MKKFKAIFLKQSTSLIKAPAMLVQGLIFLAMAFVFTILGGYGTDTEDCDDCIPAYICEVHLEDAAGTPQPTVVGLFVIMFVGMAMIASTSAMVLEDKTTQNLRFLSMADVKPFQYVLGTALSLILLAIPIVILFSLVGGYFNENFPMFMAVMMSGVVVSVLVGSVVGLSKVPVLATPLSMLMGMGPMLSGMNDNLALYLHFTFTQQLRLAVIDLNADLSSNFLIIAANGLAMLVLLIWMHRKGKLRF